MRNLIEARLLEAHALANRAFMQSIYAMLTTGQMARLWWLQSRPFALATGYPARIISLFLGARAYGTCDIVPCVLCGRALVRHRRRRFLLEWFMGDAGVGKA